MEELSMFDDVIFRIIMLICFIINLNYMKKMDFNWRKGRYYIHLFWGGACSLGIFFGGVVDEVFELGIGVPIAVIIAAIVFHFIVYVYSFIR